VGLLVRSVEMRDFRSFDRRDIDFCEGITVLVGRNASGKTNTVEALQLLTCGRSFRKPRAAHLVREGASMARLEGRLEGDGRVIDVSMVATAEGRKFLLNDKPCRPASLEGTLLSVLFNPDDLLLVKGSASARRAEVDDFAGQANQGYRKVLRAYTRAVEQRNRLLKEEVPDLALLDAWDESIALGGATLLLHRVRLFERLRAHIEGIYGEISGSEQLGCEYVCSVCDDPRGMTREELRDTYLECLALGRADDLRRQQTLVGPHRDDVRFLLDGRDARDFGSQGQQRSVVLAWKMAEVALAEEIVGSKPLLLLDDVMSELDERRREAMTGFVKAGMQTVVTTTNLGYFSPEALSGAEVVQYG